ncbi:hypothetical protein LZZ85_13765 [Terrimonas sp. NA20]|uniref:Uncharacterized protein n=1 Tax=Terrimonas ginsenosidimutans TaxID=2908004 RepID=A0ABS9KSU4_9BACT|nr:hypothetical protein [Terrimonas ginsenosidimutans]MCG2615362.1 hypothetical protein [Terrimonas ginsenosidimutans]
MSLSIIKWVEMNGASMPGLNSKVENCVEAQVIVIASAKDQDVFFDAITNPPISSGHLQAALKKV